MKNEHRLSISYYKEILTLHEEHKIYLVEHIETHKIYIKKILDIYNLNIYEYLYHNELKGIPKIIDYCQIDQQLVVIEEYISGYTLEECIQNHQLDDKSIASILYQLCDILNQLHSCKPAIIHRDIKPSNIMIRYSHEVVLLDFNAAKEESSKSNDTVLLGTEGYASPEQYGFGSSSCQSDIYSIGITLKEMVESLPCVIKDYDSIIARCTQIDAKNRYRSIVDLQNAIVSLHKDPSLKIHSTLHQFALPGFRSHTIWKMAFATAIYILLGLLCSCLQPESYQTEVALLVYQIGFFAWIMMCILITFNYMNIQKINPMCQSRYRIIRYLGVIVLYIVMLILYVIAYDIAS